MLKKEYKQTEEHKKKLAEKRKGENNPFYGKRHSQETKEKISKNRKGKCTKETHWLYKKGYLVSGKNNSNYGPNENLKGDKNPFYGKTHNDDVKNKLKLFNTGKKISKEIRKKISDKLTGTRCGEKNPAWKGGISCELYCEQWSDKDYKESIKERDGYKCLNPECNKKSNKLCIHHIDYIKKNCHPLNLITVCVSCNSKANTNRDWHKSWYQAIIKKRYIKSFTNRLMI